MAVASGSNFFITTGDVIGFEGGSGTSGHGISIGHGHGISAVGVSALEEERQRDIIRDYYDKYYSSQKPILNRKLLLLIKG